MNPRVGRGEALSLPTEVEQPAIAYKLQGADWPSYLTPYLRSNGDRVTVYIQPPLATGLDDEFRPITI